MKRSDLVSSFGPEVGNRCADILAGKVDALEHPAVVSWAKDCYHDPRQNPNALPECIMLALNAELSGYGVESIEGRHVDRYHGTVQAIYVNTGDTYNPTILHDNETGRYILTSYGDWVERHERRRQIG